MIQKPIDFETTGPGPEIEAATRQMIARPWRRPALRDLVERKIRSLTKDPAKAIANDIELANRVLLQ
ncbi:MAG: hypothetical protein H0T51_07905 [Pirellulales bacterium]|nr:hypothetical protein [Pirellulales bacterium]